MAAYDIIAFEKIKGRTRNIQPFRISHYLKKASGSEMMLKFTGIYYKRFYQLDPVTAYAF